MRSIGSIPGRLRSWPLVPFLLCVLAALIGGCGGGSESNTVTSAPSHSETDSKQGSRSVSADGGDAATRKDQADDRRLASNACKALSPAMAVAFDSRLREQARGGALDICSYSTAPGESPALQLILELIPSPSEPSESAAKAICQKLIEQTINDGSYTTSESPPLLADEAVLASTFKQDETGLVGDATTYVLDWREGGSCASLIFSSQAPARPPALSKFTDLAVLVSGSG